MIETKMYREITGYQPRVFLGMTWRMMLMFAIGIFTVPPVFALFWYLRLASFGTYAVWLMVIPLAAFALRPKGLPFEKYIKYVFAHHFTKRLFLYSTQNVEEVKPNVSARKLRKLRREHPESTFGLADVSARS